MSPDRKLYKNTEYLLQKSFIGVLTVIFACVVASFSSECVVARSASQVNIVMVSFFKVIVCILIVFYSYELAEVFWGGIVSVYSEYVVYRKYLKKYKWHNRVLILTDKAYMKDKKDLCRSLRLDGVPFIFLLKGILPLFSVVYFIFIIAPDIFQFLLNDGLFELFAESEKFCTARHLSSSIQ